MALIPLPRGRRVLFVLLCALSATLANSPGARAQGAPVVEFVSDRVYVLEDSGLASVPVSLTGTVWSATSVSASTIDSGDNAGTADLDDYVGTGGFVLWNRFESGLRDFLFEVRVDAQVEPDETVVVELLPSNNGLYELGSRTLCEVVILNDDSGIRPWFDLAPPFRLGPQGDLMYVADAGESVELTVRLSDPAPAGYSVSYEIDGGAPQSLSFAQNSLVATLVVPPATEQVPGYPFAMRHVHLIDPGPAAHRSIGGQDARGVYPYEGIDPVLCLACGMVLASQTAIDGIPECHEACAAAGICDLPRAGLPDLISTLQAYRDGVLALTESGQYYISLYVELSGALFRESFRNPALFFELVDMAGDWQPAFAALAGGSGSSYVISPSMQASLTDILDHLQSSSDAAILEAVQRERTRLMLDTVEGLTMDQFQARLETLGGKVGIENRSSLSSLKARFSKPAQ